MVELTEREKKLVHINLIMYKESFQKYPLDAREKMLMTTMEMNGINYDHDEMLEIGKAINAEQEAINNCGFQFVSQNKEVFTKEILARLFKKKD